MREILSRYDVLSFCLDFITYGAACLGGILMYLRRRATIWLFSIAFFGKVLATFYNIYVGPGLHVVNTEWIIKTLIAWAIFFGAVYLAWLFFNKNIGANEN